jgi:spermidine synthase
MSTRRPWPILSALAILVVAASARATVIFEQTTPYHHIRVIDENGMRMLCFDDGRESRMSLANPLQGHFEYTEYFHLPWLWNTGMTNVLMIGLGGGSTQNSYEHYYPGVTFDTVEIDPAVLQVAEKYFKFQESPTQKVHIEDGRVFLRRSTARYGAILLDAYVQGRYGGCIPQHLATKEFFEIARSHLATNGVLAYNVIGTLTGWRADIVGAICHTLKTVFPQVYVFPARSSQNVVIVATTSAIPVDLAELRRRASAFAQSEPASLPALRERVEVLQPRLPPNVEKSPILTDDYAPVEGLMESGGK